MRGISASTCVGPKLLRKALLAGRKVGAPISDAGIAGAMLRAVQVSGSRTSRRHLRGHAAIVLSARARGVVSSLRGTDLASQPWSSS